MSKMLKYLPVAVALASLAGCGGGSHQDLYQFMAEVKAHPAGEIEPIPVFEAYQPFKYSVAALRSPFDPPQIAVSSDGSYGKVAIEPDETRSREYLEGFSFSSLSMVGTLTKDGITWALINDSQGGIHRVTVGNYIGKNHGKIIEMNKSQLDVIEIVPDGKNGWVERPRTLALKEK